MKKLFTFALCLTALLILCTVTASAAMVNKDGHYTEEANKIDEIKAGQAGEGDVAWDSNSKLDDELRAIIRDL